MDAIRKIEAALAAGPTNGPWKADAYGTVKVGRFSLCTPSSGGSFSMMEALNMGKANAAYIAACNPAAIREVLQTLASKEAELAEAELKYVSLFGELQNAMEEIAKLREALAPFAKFACSPLRECQCHNCVARDLLALTTTPQPTE